MKAKPSPPSILPLSRRGTALLCFVFAVYCSAGNLQNLSSTESSPWIVDAPVATRAVLQGAPLLDARFYGLYALSHVSGARSIDWQDFSREEEEGGLLLREEELQESLMKFGLKKERPILVYGGGRNGWGEEGRIVWMLREAGYRAFLVNGGDRALYSFLGRTYGPLQGSPDQELVRTRLKAFEDSSIPEDRAGEGPRGPADEEAPAGQKPGADKNAAENEESEHQDHSDQGSRGPSTNLPSIFADSAGPAPSLNGTTVSLEELRSIYKDRQVILLDVREKREYEGSTPYGESRGGHIPGAIHIYYEDFLDGNGYVLSKGEILKLLAREGISPEQRIISYCTGGVRSAMVTVILQHHGLNAHNFAGSMWQWSSGDPEIYPLTLDDRERPH